MGLFPSPKSAKPSPESKKERNDEIYYKHDPKECRKNSRRLPPIPKLTKKPDAESAEPPHIKSATNLSATVKSNRLKFRDLENEYSLGLDKSARRISYIS